MCQGGVLECDVGWHNVLLSCLQLCGARAEHSDCLGSNIGVILRLFGSCQLVVVCCTASEYGLVFSL